MLIYFIDMAEYNNIYYNRIYNITDYNEKMFLNQKQRQHFTYECIHEAFITAI